MTFAEKFLYCNDCKKQFIFSVEEQEFHASQGFPNVPKVCPSCRQTKRNERIRETNASEDFMSGSPVFPVTCTQCGKATRLPFLPRQNEQVYYSN
jgi:CxxC-x17-CxxC domain-containing protein